MSNRIIVRAAFAVVFALVAGASFGYNKSMYPYTLPAGAQGAALGCERAVAGQKLELGKWYTNFQVCKAYADANGIPLLAVWSNHGCIHCWYTDVVFVQPEFRQWQAVNDAGKVICCYMAGGDDDLDQVNSSAYNWMWYGGGNRLGAYPFVVMWWKKNGVNIRKTGDDFCKGTASSSLSFTDSTIPQRIVNVEAELTRAFAGWKATPPYVGGNFAFEESEQNRLEAEAGTESVTFELVREEAAAAYATNNTVALLSPAGVEVVSEQVAWEAGETNKLVTVSLAGVGFAEDGDQATLVVRDAAGAEQGSTHVTYVDEPVSAGNPLWIGERARPAAQLGGGALLRNAAGAPELGFGEWTMDLDAAKAKAAAADGDAYTLVAVQGSLWCPDCFVVETNFLALTDGAGNNRFEKWAVENQVALAVVDVPPFSTNYVTVTRATLLSRAEVRGASGLGYLTRKGVTDAEAAEVLERNRLLVSTDTGAGGFHRPEDSSAFRTGVPIFVLLRKDGTVAARLTRFAAIGRNVTKDNWDNYIKRFDELLAMGAAGGGHSDLTEIENNDPSTTGVALASAGGNASGELSHSDAMDFYRLGISGGALQKVTLAGDSSAVVSAQFFRLDGATGRKEAVGEAASGALSAGVTLEHEFAEAGEYFVKVSIDEKSGEFDVAAAKPDNFVSYAISGTTVLVPQEGRNEDRAPAGSTKVTMRLVKDQLYRIENLNVAANAAVLEPKDAGDPYNAFYTAKVAGDVELTTANPGGVVAYWLWKPGKVGFAKASATAKETDGAVSVEVIREDGVSGAVKAHVALNGALTFDPRDEGGPRYYFAETDLDWADGSAVTNAVEIVLEDDIRFDGEFTVALDLTLISGEGVELGGTNFVLTVTEDDLASPGQVAIAGAEPFFSKKLAVYAKESEGATIYLRRLVASDGAASVGLKSSLASAVVDVDGGRVSWANHNADEKAVKVTGVPAGKSARLTLVEPSAGFKVVSTSSYVTVFAVADDAPEFQNAENAMSAYRYVSVSNLFPLAAAPAGRVSFTKTAGTLPAGLKAGYDAAANALAIWGTPTAKAGSFQVVYQVKDGSKAGLTAKIDIALSDPTDAAAASETNPVNVTVAKSRTFTDLAVVNAVNNRLAGVLQITVPTRGNLSAKYTCESGVISFSAKGWDDFNPATRDLHASLVSRKAGFALDAVCQDDGTVDVSIVDPMYEGISLDAEANPRSLWSKTNSASAWQGYYTVALPVDPEAVDEDTANLAPRGTGYVTLKMVNASAWNAGKVTWKGMYPNGTAFSGSSALTWGEEWAVLPMFKRSTSDTLSVCAKVRAGAVGSDDPRSVLAADGVVSGWVHNERDDAAGANFGVDLKVYGGIYDSTRDLAACCQEDYETTSPTMLFVTGTLGETSYGAVGPVAETTVTVGERSLALGDGAPQGMTLRLDRANGVVSGAVRLPYGDGSRYINAKWAGVILQGWGPGCLCSPEDVVYRPFINGSYYFTDKISYEAVVGGRPVMRSVNVKLGGDVNVE